MQQIRYRIGEINDCRKIAEGICQASGGIMDFLMQAWPLQAADPVGMLAQELAVDQPSNSFREACIAEEDGNIAGIVYAYPAELFGADEELRKNLGAENWRWVEEFFTSRVENSLFLDSLYVWPNWRRRGIGDALIEQVKLRAAAAGRAKVSLMVLADNHGARSVYARAGFQLEKAIRLDRHPLIPHDGGALLLSVPCQ